MKLLLTELGYAATLGAPVVPELVRTGMLAGIPIDDIRSKALTAAADVQAHHSDVMGEWSDAAAREATVIALLDNIQREFRARAGAA